MYKEDVIIHAYHKSHMIDSIILLYNIIQFLDFEYNTIINIYRYIRYQYYVHGNVYLSAVLSFSIIPKFYTLISYSICSSYHLLSLYAFRH